MHNNINFAYRKNKYASPLLLYDSYENVIVVYPSFSPAIEENTEKKEWKPWW